MSSLFSNFPEGEHWAYLEKTPLQGICQLGACCVQ